MNVKTNHLDLECVAVEWWRNDKYKILIETFTQKITI